MKASTLLSRSLYFARVFRTAFAVISALLIAMWMGFANPYWAPTTVLVLESLSSFEMLDKTFWRLLGTLIGGSLGLVVVALCAGNPTVTIIACSIATCVTIFFVQKWNPPFWRWVLFSLLLVVLYTVNSPENAFLISIYRISGVGLGAVIVLLSHIVVPAKDCRTVFSETFSGMVVVLLSIVDRTIELHENTKVTSTLPLGKFTALSASFIQACQLRSKSSLKKRNFFALAVDMDSIGRNLFLLNNARIVKSLSDQDIEWVKKIRKQLLQMQAAQFSTFPCQLDKAGNRNQLIDEIERSLQRIAAFLTGNAEYLQPPVMWKPPVCVETELISGDTLRLYKAALCGAAVAISMSLWRYLGWPAGSAFVFITLASTLYMLTPPHFTLKFLAGVYFIASSVSGIFTIFVLPQISETGTFTYVIFAFYFALSLLIQSSNPKLRGLASLIAILINSTMNGYVVTINAFTIYSYIALSLIGAVFLTWLLTKIFFPASAEEITLFHQEKLLDELANVECGQESSEDKQFSQILFRIRTIMGWSLKLPPTPHLAGFFFDVYCLQSVMLHIAFISETNSNYNRQLGYFKDLSGALLGDK